MNLRGAFKKFCNSIWCTNDTSKIFMLLFNTITLNTNVYVTLIKKLFYASQIELWWPAVQIRLSTQWPAWSHCHHGTTSSDDEIDRRHWVLGLLSRVGMTTIPIQCSLLQPAKQEQGSKMISRSNRPLSRTCRACNKNSIWLASKSCLTSVTYALVLRVIMLNNNIKILLVICASYWVAKLFERPSYRYGPWPSIQLKRNIIPLYNHNNLKFQHI